jgi:peptidoglycan/xylan/chitin deacetylase (PgdA/CDA1 family)
VSERRFVAQLDFLTAAGWHTATVEKLAAPLPERTVLITFDDGYADNATAFEALAARGMCATWFIVSADIGRCAGWVRPGEPARPMLDAGQLWTMAAAGMEIGGHTRHHCRLTEVDAATRDAELQDCKADLEDLLGRAVDSFAYPYGLYDDQVVAATERAGFRIACTTRSGWVNPADGPLQIRRVAVFAPDTAATLARKLTFADNDASWGRVAAYYGGRLRASRR